MFESLKFIDIVRLIDFLYPSKRSFSTKQTIYMPHPSATHNIVCTPRIHAPRHHPPSVLSSKKRVTRISKSNKLLSALHPDQRRARTCYAHLVTRLGKLGAVRLVPLSPPSPLSLFSLPFLFPFSPPPFALQLVSTTRSVEPPQTGTMSRYCDPLQAAESCISSSMFSLPISLPFFLLPVLPSWLYIDSVPAFPMPRIRLFVSPLVSISA